MTLFEISAILLTAAACASFINYKWLKLPPAIGLMLLAMLASLVAIALKSFNFFDITQIEHFLNTINFSELVFHGMLSFLLFAGAMQINLEDLKNAKLPIAITATISTIISVLLIGIAFYFIAQWLGFYQINFLVALLFGAIISPTDPVAVIAIIQKMQVPKKIGVKIAGESLFNDGIAIVIFLIILQLLNKNENFTSLHVIGLLAQAAGGGLLFGWILGWLTQKILSQVDSYQTELLITLALTTGGYVLAEQFHVSAPLAMVVAGIMVGNRDREKIKNIHVEDQVSSFWLLIEEILNAILFILIGLEMLVIKVDFYQALLGIICIFLILLVRYISVAVPIQCIKPFYTFTKGTTMLLTWGGLRGALPIAMVLALTQQDLKAILLPCVYFVVVFSILFQGLTFDKLLRLYGFKQKQENT